MNQEIFIWTEAFNCGEILPPMVKSYLTHHDESLNIFATEKDFEFISSIKDSRLIFHCLEKTNMKVHRKIVSGYNKGHSGTANLWTYLLRHRKEQIFIHFDADNIFLDNVTAELIDKLCYESYALVGSRRPYRMRAYRLTGRDAEKLNNLPDVVNTDCFGFNTSYIKKFPSWLLKRKIVGKRQLFRPIIDYFDPISFEIIDKGGKVYFLDSPTQGKSAKTNFDSDFHNKRISFAAVGSGLNFFKNPKVKSSPGYKKFALASYSLYSNRILGIPLNIPMLDDESLNAKINKLDKNKWALTENHRNLKFDTK